MPTESKYSQRRIRAVEKQRMALELRMAGRRWDEIAQTVGYANHTGAIAAVKVALEKTLQEPAEHYRALTLERLTKVLQVLWPRMLNGDLAAADRVLRVIADISSLMGLTSMPPLMVQQVAIEYNEAGLRPRLEKYHDLINEILAEEALGEPGGNDVAESLHTPRSNGQAS